ncbi:hypothetical protein ACLIA0_13660 [Bacillaceae bacterium W0354]
MSTLVNVFLYSLPILIVLLFLYWGAKDAWFNFNKKNDEKLNEIIRLNNELRQEIDDLKAKIK